MTNDSLPEIRINLEEIRERFEHLEAQIEKLQVHNKALENELACTPGQAALLKAIWRLYDLASYLRSSRQAQHSAGRNMAGLGYGQP